MSRGSSDSSTFHANRAVLGVLSEVLHDPAPGAVDDAEVTAAAIKLATAVLDMCDQAPHPQSKLKQLLFSLRSNEVLRQNVISGAITPAELATMPSDRLATEAVRQRDRQAGCVAQEAASVPAAALEIQREKKTGGSKGEWFGGEDDESDAPTDHSAVATTIGPPQQPHPTSSPRKRPAETHAAAAHAAPNEGAASVSDEVDKPDRVFVSKRLRKAEDDVVSASEHVQQLTAVRARAVREQLWKSSGGVKERAATVARTTLDTALIGLAPVTREKYKSILKAVVHELVADCSRAGRGGAEHAWQQRDVTDHVARQLAREGLTGEQAAAPPAPL